MLLNIILVRSDAILQLIGKGGERGRGGRGREGGRRRDIVISSYYCVSLYRDSLLCSILDGVRATGNKDVCVKMKRTAIGQRLGPLTLPVEEEVESMFLKLLGTTPPGPAFISAVEEFNSNIGYSGLNHAVTQEGLFTENKEKLITQALISLLSKDGDQASLSAYDLECQFHSLRRLVASKAGYSAFTELPK